MKIRLLAALMITLGADGAMAQSSQSPRPPSEAKAEDRNPGPRNNLPNTKTTLRSQPRSSVTLRQVERETGGKVIGAKPVSVQGRQLNQIKVQMPNGRIIIHQQLFDENGRSVETVQKADDDPGQRNRVADH
jgi:hypothetical protein